MMMNFLGFSRSVIPIRMTCRNSFSMHLFNKLTNSICSLFLSITHRRGGEWSISIFLLALLQKLVGNFFLIFRREIREIWWEFWREFCGIFSDDRIKAQQFRGKFRGIFRKKIRSSKKIFRAKFTLQMCHLKVFQGRPNSVVYENVFGATGCFSEKSLHVSNVVHYPNITSCDLNSGRIWVL